MGDSWDCVNKGDQPRGPTSFWNVKFSHQKLIQECLLLEEDVTTLNKLSIQTTMKGIASLKNCLMLTSLSIDKKI